MPAPPSARPDAPAQAPIPGQWVYTDQYGWVWMPYGNQYTRVSPGGDPPTMYVYGPTYGWCWVSAPWVWGWGPLPFFGVYGTVHFGWWGNGFGHWYGFAGRYRSWGGPGWGRGGWGRPGYGGYRGGFRGGYRGGYGFRR
jgi:hypothetical protein